MSRHGNAGKHHRAFDLVVVIPEWTSDLAGCRYYLTLINKLYVAEQSPDPNYRLDVGGIVIWRAVAVSAATVALRLAAYFGKSDHHIDGVCHLAPSSVATQYFLVRSIGADGTVSTSDQTTKTITDPQWNIAGKLSGSAGDIGAQRSGALTSNATQDTRTATTPARDLNRLDITFHSAMPGLAYNFGVAHFA